MKKSLFIILFGLLLFNSNVFAQKYQLGDTVKFPDKTQGIVYNIYRSQTGQDIAWLMTLSDEVVATEEGLKFYYLKSYAANQEYQDPNIENEIYANSDTCGIENTNKITLKGDATAFPAAWACVNYGNGWYLPSVGQMRSFLGFLSFIASGDIVPASSFIIPNETKTNYWVSTGSSETNKCCSVNKSHGEIFTAEWGRIHTNRTLNTLYSVRAGKSIYVGYTVSFASNGVALADKVKKHTVKPSDFSGVTPTAFNGYTFVGWSSNPIDGVVETVPPLVNDEFTPTTDMTLHAVYKCNYGNIWRTTVPLITVNEYVNNVNTPKTDYVVTVGTTTSPNGFTFDGWASEAINTYEDTYEKSYSEGDIIYDANKNIYAVYKDNRTNKYISLYGEKNTMDIVADTEWDNVSIVAGNVVTVKDGARLTINGLVGMNAGQLVVEEGGEFVYNMLSLPVIAKRTIEASTPKAGYNMRWYLISSPFNNLAIAGSAYITDPSSSYALYRYNESTVVWENYKNAEHASTFTNFENGRGYLYANTENRELSIEGNININAVQYPLTYSAEEDRYKGWNIIGNPYLYDIELGEGCAIEPTDLLEEGFYRLHADGTWGTLLTTEPIKAQEGVMIHANRTETLTINPIPASNTTKSNDAYVRVNLTDGTFKDWTFGVFREGNNFHKTAHYDKTAPMIYSVEGGEAYAINYLGEDANEMNISVSVKSAGTFTITTSTNSDFEKLVLVDRMTGVETDMLLENSYTFETDENGMIDRFVLRFDYSHFAVDENEDNGYEVRVVDGVVVVDGLDSNAQIQIFDVLGRQQRGRLTMGSYVVRVLNGDDSFVKKIIVEK